MILYADMVGGAAGDMIIAAMLDCGLPLEHLRRELDKLKLPGLSISAEKVMRGAVRCTKFQVDAPAEEHHRTFNHIRGMIENSGLSPEVKERSVKIFRKLAEAEGAVHGLSADEVHFHEVGAADSIADIVGAAVGMEYYQAKGFYLSDFLFGKGTVECAHGTIPIPAPATVMLTQGFSFRKLDIDCEMTTPTGAAILTAYSLGKLPCSPFSATVVGCGAGSREIEGAPNFLRLWVMIKPVQNTIEEREIIIEANIDDMEAELYPYLMDKLFLAEAKDVFFTPVTMKKGRPGVLVTIIADENKLREIGSILFRESATIGLRWRSINRWKLPRQICEVETAWGVIKAKRVEFEGDVRVLPEYEECRALAEKAKIPLSEVYRAVIIAGNQV
ncbi:MAG: nickel pincer cofactor biosynthesis protein LarC [candidate division Zixibacteria bacterium]|nr:nickel pincer cofactor biosynthesis protein LarC [Candidatus Tariuqbacter arcticus]